MYRETTDMSNHVYRREWVCIGKPLTCLIMYTGRSGSVQGNHCHVIMCTGGSGHVQGARNQQQFCYVIRC